MKNFSLLSSIVAFVVTILATSCEESGSPGQSRWYVPKNADNMAVQEKGQLWGHWVCNDFVELVRARRSIRTVRSRPMFLEIVFKPEFGDSVLLVTGYTNFFAAYKKQGADSILIQNVTPGKNIVLYSSNNVNVLQLEDTLRGGKNSTQVHSWTFTKADAAHTPKNQSKPQVIHSVISQEILAGIYMAEALPATEVAFNTNGTISGWEGYNQYEICTGGECFTYTRVPIDIITLSGDGGTKNFAFMLKGNDSLYLYHLNKDSRKEQYTYSPNGVAFAFKKK